MNVMAMGGVMTRSPITSAEAFSNCGVPLLRHDDFRRFNVIDTLLQDLIASPQKDRFWSHRALVSTGE